MRNRKFNNKRAKSVVLPVILMNFNIGLIIYCGIVIIIDGKCAWSDVYCWQVSSNYHNLSSLLQREFSPRLCMLIKGMVAFWRFDSN